MNLILKYGLAIMFFLLLIVIVVAYVLKTKEVSIGLLVVPLVIPIQFLLPKFASAVLAALRNNPENVKYQEELEAINKKYVCEDRESEE